MDIESVMCVKNVYGVLVDINIDEINQREFTDNLFPKATGDKVEVRVKFTGRNGKTKHKDYFLGEFLEKLGFDEH